MGEALQFRKLNERFCINLMNINTYKCVKLMIDYQLLHALHAVITEKGFEKAAKVLFITQSAVSRRIHQLESTLGEPVIVRSQPPSPTELGKRLLNHFQQVKQLEVALNISSLQEDQLSAKPLTVKLATNADSLATWLPQALAVPEDRTDTKFRFELIEEDQSVTLNRMRAGEVMVCICSNEEPVNGGLVYPLGIMRYHVIASPDFVKRHKITSVEQLTDLPCLIYDEHDKLQHQFLTEMNGSTPSYVHYCPSAEGFKQSMIAGLGYGLLPHVQLDNQLETGELINLVPDYHLDTPLFWHYWQTESPQLKALRLYAGEVAKHKLIQA